MRKRKLLTGMLIAVMTLGMSLSGCGKKNYDKLLDPDHPVTITVWHYYNGVQQTQYDEMVREFNESVGRNKGIYVEAYSKNSIAELADGVLASVNGDPGAEDAPDIFMTYAETAYKIDEMGKLADLSAYFSKKELGEYVDEYIAEGAISGKDSLKIFPIAKSTEVFMLNVTDWKAFAAKESLSYEDLATWEGVAATAEKYYKYSNGKAFFGRDAVANYMIIGAKQLGHPFSEVDEDGNVTVSADKATLKKLWECFYVPYIKGYYTAEGRFRSDDAKIGSIIALVCSTTGAAYYPSAVTVNDDKTYPIENVVLKVPNFKGAEPYVVQQGAGLSVIKSDEKTEYACSVFLKWFTEEERNLKFSVNSGYLPVKTAANDYKRLEADESAEGMSDTMKNTLKVAMEEIHTYSLYTSPPFDASAEVRDFIGKKMEESAKADREAIESRIAGGASRETVLAEYTDDAAFEKWFSDFEKGLKDLTGDK